MNSVHKIKNEIKTIFISRTSLDLSDYVKSIKKTLEKAGYNVVTMVDFGAQPHDAVKTSLEEIKNTDAVIGIYAKRYGYIPENNDLSITEQEFDYALKGKPVFAFIVDNENTELKPESGEDDETIQAKEKQKKLKKFISRINTALVREKFKNLEDLKIKILESLSRYEKKIKVFQGQPNTLLLKLNDKQIKLFYNDKHIDIKKSEFDHSLINMIENYDSARKNHTTQISTKSQNKKISPADIALNNMGNVLGKKIFSSKMAEKTKDFIEKAFQNNKRIQLSLKTNNSIYNTFPLQTLQIKPMKNPFALEPCVDFSRVCGNRKFDSFPEISGPLKILMVAASPIKGEHHSVLDYENELGKIMDIVENTPIFAKEQRKPIIHILDQATLKTICNAFELNKYHILHISTHGTPEYIILEDEDGATKMVSADDFIKQFPVNQKPVLTMLSACYTGRSPNITKSDNIKFSFAETLIKNGFPYVIAMQDTVTDTYATQFAQTLYQKLSFNKNPVIEDCFSQACIELEAKRVDENKKRALNQQIHPEWMIPALYKGNLYKYLVYENDPISFDRDMETFKQDFETNISHREIGEFVGRRRELLTIKHELINKSRHGCVLITGMGGVGKSTLAARALANAVYSGKKFDIVSQVGQISLVDFLKRFDCKGDNLEMLLNDFFQNQILEKGKNTIFLFDNFEDNLILNNDLIKETENNDFFPELIDKTLLKFLSDFIYSGKARIIITSRYLFKLLKNQHLSLTHINLGALSNAETRKLISRLKGLKALNSEERLEIIHILGGHPRTLEFLDAILQDGKFTYNDVQKRLNNRLPEDILEIIKKQKTLNENIQNTVTLAARDCFIDQLLKRLSNNEKFILYYFSVFQTPRPANAVSWFKKKQKIEINTQKTINHFIKLSLVYKDQENYFVHSWTCEYLKQIMGKNIFKKVNNLAAEYLYEPKKISIDDAIEGWHHFLNAHNIEKAHNVARSLEDQLNTWGHWELEKIICNKMINVTEKDSKIHGEWVFTRGNLFFQQGDYKNAKNLYKKALEISEKLKNLNGMAESYHQMGMIQQDQGGYEGAQKLYKQSLEIKEKLKDLQGMAKSYNQIGTLAFKQQDHKAAFILFLRAFIIFNQLKAPYAKQALNGLCKIAQQQPKSWDKWVIKEIRDKSFQSQTIDLIKQKLTQVKESKQDEINKTLVQMKVLYDKLGEKKFIEFVKKQTGQKLPKEILNVLKKMPDSEKTN
ncbi:MAG: hypothetical protein B6I26_07335 [Desulfobacteraceae bacterium 4572_130]|nr:MAG: hypothetical protein B6I26_07335 [Desulfobacteraceae bacterium 4572_130]